MSSSTFIQTARNHRPGPATWLLVTLAVALLVALVAIGPERLHAQIEGERGIPPVASTEDIHVTGIEVDVTGKSAADAREQGWKLARRKAWERIEGAAMSDAQIDAMVLAIVIEKEQIGPRRYIATLGVIFDRAKAGQFVGAAGGKAPVRSAPLLVIPVVHAGGVRQVFEVRNPWQRAWAHFQTAASPVDYVRPTGAGGESLILTAGQTGRRSRIWWRTILDQFEAADVLVPVARLERLWPGGPVRGTFTARFGPDNTYLDSFTLTADDDEALPEMLEEAVQKLDRIYRRALVEGVLTPDPTLLTEQKAFDAALAELRQRLLPDAAAPGEAVQPAGTPVATPTGQPAPAASATYTVQFATPDAAAVDAALAAVRGVPGVQSAATTSLAIGGTSVMRVTMTGELGVLASVLRAQGWQVSAGENVLRISR